MPDPPPAAPSFVPAPIADLVLPPVGGGTRTTAFRLTAEPIFAPGELARLAAPGGGSETLADRAGGRWRPLPAWLEEPARAVVRCRRRGLSVRLAAADPEIGVLPLAAGASGEAMLAAALVLADGAGEAGRPLDQVALDESRGHLRLDLPFADSAEGRSLYERVLVAMTAPASAARIEVACTHALTELADAAAPVPFELPWESLGGGLAGGPGVCSWSPGRLDTFVRGLDHALWHKGFEGGWSGWESLGGVLTSDPAAVSWGPGRIDVFARGLDNALWHRWFDGRWHDWESLGGALNSGPAVCSWGSRRLDVFAAGTDNALWHRWFDGRWHDWESLGGVLTSDPGAVSWGPGRIDVFVRGLDLALWHKWFAGGWSGWESLGGRLDSGPDACAWGPDFLDAFVRGTDGALWHRLWDGGRWRDWARLGGRPASDPSAVCWGRGRVDLFARGADGTLLHAWGDGAWPATMPAPAPVPRAVEVPLAFAVPLAFRRDERPEVYPDLPVPGTGEWRELPARDAGSRPLFFRRSERADTFFVLPTSYRLGFHVDPDGATVHPPLRATLLRPEGAGEAAAQERIRATLTALPHLDPADREHLRRHLGEVVLGGLLPFVRLAPAAGLAVRFVATYTSDVDALPESVVFRGAALAAERELTLDFDMRAGDYGLFCEMLRRGLRGRVELAAEGFAHAVEVVLDLGRLTTNGLRVEALAVTEGGSGLALRLANLLAFPVRLGPPRAFRLDRGDGRIPDLLFAAEAHEPLAEGRTLARRGAAGDAVDLAVPPPSGIGTGWDETVLALGTLEVEGGTPQDWLDRVHRDPSLQPLDFSLTVEVVFPDAARERTVGVRAVVVKPGEATPRAEREIAPGAPPWELTLRLPLAELAAVDGAAPVFHLEYVTLYRDLGAGLPQRQAVRLADRDLVLRALAETAGSRYTILHGTAREDAPDRAAAERIVERLREGGATWQVA